MNQHRAIRIGIIADTDGLSDPVIRRHFTGVDHILHAGDIGDRSVIEQLEQIAPVTAVSGNIDHNDEQSGFPAEAVIELAGLRVALRHILHEGGKVTKDGRAFWIASNQTSASLVIRISRRPNGSARRCSSILALQGHSSSSFPRPGYPCSCEARNNTETDSAR
jgi:hypothetical protein